MVKKRKAFFLIVILLTLLVACSTETPPGEFSRPVSGPQNEPTLVETLPPTKAAPSIFPTNLPSPSVTPVPEIPPVIHPGWRSYTNANYIRAMILDRNGELWTGGNGGVVHWISDKKYIKYTTEHGLASNFVTAIAQTADGALWFATYGSGISRFDGTNWTVYTTKDGLADNFVLSLAVDPEDVLWVGTLKGLSVFDGKTWNSDLLANKENSRYKCPFQYVCRVDAIAVGPDGSVWIGGTWGTGLKQIKAGEMTDFSYQLGKDEVTALAFAPDGALWIGTHSDMTRYAKNNWQNFPVLSEDSLIGVAAIAVTSKNEVWVGFSTWMGQSQYTRAEQVREEYFDQDDKFFGVTYFDGKSWENRKINQENGLVENEIRAILVGPDHSVYFGSYREGVARYENNAWNYYQTDDRITSNYYCDVKATKTMLLAGCGNGLTQLESKNNQFITPIQGYVLDFQADPNGEIWAATLRGLLEFDGMQWRSFNKENHQDIDGPISIVTLQDGSHLFSFSSHKKILRYDGTIWSIYKAFDKRTLSIGKMIVSQDGKLWVNAVGDGIYTNIGDQWEYFVQDTGLDSVLDFAVTEDGKVWVLFDSGLAFYDGKIKNQYITGRTIVIGSAEIPLTGGMVCDSNGSLWFSSTNGLVKMDGDDRELFTTLDGLSSNLVGMRLYLDDDNILWVSTDAGISRFETSSIK